VKTALSPWVVLVVAVVLPGMGQVLNNQPTFADQEASFVGKSAGGVFAYAMSVVDAYRAAALRRLVKTSSTVGCAER
jgi:hypothetical protein